MTYEPVYGNGSVPNSSRQENTLLLWENVDTRIFLEQESTIILCICVIRVDLVPYAGYGYAKRSPLSTAQSRVSPHGYK
uniref:Ovule protein n=1 Tax=Steinernema glaseri TaxID=37863 RepID=A0A1I7Y829_9BILA